MQELREKEKQFGEAERGGSRRMIEVRNLYKIYRVGTNKVYALNGVSFDIFQGEFVAIVGTSGSGKSTLLNMLAGLEPPTKGAVRIAGRRIEQMNEKELVAFRRQNVGFIFQSYNLLNTMNGLENVAMPLMFRGISRAVREKAAMKYMKLMGVQDQAKHMPNQMSGGQQQRIGIARAMVVDPKIIFADEPTGNLDSHTTMDVLRLMQKLVHEQNKTLVMVTHDNNLASYADKQIRIVDGKIVSVEYAKRGRELEGGAVEEEERLSLQGTAAGGQQRPDDPLSEAEMTEERTAKKMPAPEAAAAETVQKIRPAGNGGGEK